MKKLIAAAILGAATIMAAGTVVSAEKMTTFDPNVSVETPNSNWHEVKDPETTMTLTDGDDIVKINEFKQGDMIPAATTENDKYAEIYQTFYTADAKTYMVTGFAVNKDSIDEVRSIVESISLADHKKAETNTDKKEEKKEEKKENSGAKATDNKMVLFFNDGSTVTITEYTNGEWRDANGVEYWKDGEEHWMNEKDQHLWESNPNNTEGNLEPTGVEFTLYTEDGNCFTVFGYDDDNYYDRKWIRYSYYGDGVWESENGDYYTEFNPLETEDAENYDDADEDADNYDETDGEAYLEDFEGYDWE